MANFVSLLDVIYPVDSVYISMSSISPAETIGGTWTKAEDHALVGQKPGDASGTYFGNSKIAPVQLPQHKHTIKTGAPVQDTDKHVDIYWGGTAIARSPSSTWVGQWNDFDNDNNPFKTDLVDDAGNEESYVGVDGTFKGCRGRDYYPYSLGCNVWYRTA